MTRSAVHHAPPHRGAPPTGGLVRQRLVDRLAEASAPRLVLVSGPPGSGKTTALAHWATEQRRLVSWRRVGVHETSVELTSALGEGLGVHGVTTPAGLAVAVGAAAVRPVLVVDGVERIPAGDATALGELVLATAGICTLVLSGRTLPRWNLARAELGEPIRLGPSDLRFRPWEVEQLYREVYGEPLAAADAVALTHRTDGWAAALSLFHVSLADHHAGVAGAISALDDQAAYAADYLEAELFGSMSGATREFLRRTAPLDVLNVARCSVLLATDDAEPRLAALSRGWVLETEERDRTHRLNPVVRQHLLTELRHDLGASAMRTWLERCADVVEAEGSLHEALVIRCQAADWAGVRRLVRAHGYQLAGARTAAWVHLLPPELVVDEPWAELAMATALLEDGRFVAAHEAARHAHSRMTTDDARSACDLVLRRCRTWNAGPEAAVPRWEDVVRAATRRDPAAAGRLAQGLTSPMRPVCHGIALVLEGNVDEATVVLRRGIDAEPHDVTSQLVSRLLLSSLAALIAPPGQATPDLDLLHVDAERHGRTWLARMAAGVAVARGGDPRDGEVASGMVVRCDELGDRWGAALISLAMVLARVRAGRWDIAELERLVDRFRRLDAGVLESWARALHAVGVVTADLPDATRDARAAESLARSAGVPGALALAYAALGSARGEDGHEFLGLAASTARAVGLGPVSRWRWLTPVSASDPATDAHLGVAEQHRADLGSANAGRRGAHSRTALSRPDTPGSTVEVRCLGGFELHIDGRPADLSALRPRARHVLRLLAVHAGRPLHRERFAASLWPDLSPSAAAHNLHVAVSSLRGALEPDLPRRRSRLVVREGPTYRLVLADRSHCDLSQFDDALQMAGRARSLDEHVWITQLRRAVDLYTGDLLPEDGSAEWLTDLREAYKLRAAEAAYHLAEGLLAHGDPAGAAKAASHGVRIDRWHDGAWRLLIESCERVGDVAAAGRARRSYGDVLQQLGVVG